MKNIKFEIIDQPRTPDGGFGKIMCQRCGANSTVFLKVIPGEIVMCKGCFLDGAEVISDAIIKQALRGRYY